MSDEGAHTNDEGQVVSERAREVVRTVLAEATSIDLFPENPDRLLRQLASLGESLAPALAEGLHSADSQARILAAWLLLKLAESDTAAVTNPRSVERARRTLVAALEGDDDLLRLFACVQLASGAVPDEATPALTKLLERPEAELAVFAAAALTWRGEAAAAGIKNLTGALVSNDDQLTIVAAKALVRLGVRREEAVAALVRLLSETASPFRYPLLLAIRDAGPSAEAAAPLLSKIASDPNTKSVTRAAAAEALGAVAQGAESQELLLGLLKDQDVAVNLGAINGLRRIGRIPPAAIGSLQALLRSADPERRRAAALGFQWLGPAATPALPNLISALCDEGDQEMIGDLARACAQIGPAAAKPLCAALEQGNLKWTGAISTALVMLGRDAAPAIAESLASGEALACWTGVGLLRALGREAEPAIPALAELLGRVSDERAMYVLSALAACSDGARGAIPAIVAFMLERQGEAAELAGRLVTVFGHAAIPALTERLTVASDEGRRRIEQVLERIRPQSQRFFERLLTLNADKELLLFLFAGRIIQESAPIGLRKVSRQLETMPDAARLGVATSEASLRDMLSDLASRLGVQLTRQTAKGSTLTDDGRSLLAEAQEYLGWRGLLG